MSTPAATPLKIKGHTGWFAAAANWQAALQELSDGAFKLFVHISLDAERSTGRLLFRQQDLARALRKSRRSIGTYLQELEQRQVCRVRRSPNQHAPGVLEIAEQYWPTSAASRLTRSAPLDRLRPSMWRPSERCCWSVPASVADTRPRIAVWLPRAQENRLADVLEFDALLEPRTQVRLLAQRTPRGSPSVPCITSVPFYRRSRAASFPPAIGLSIKCKCCDWKNAGSKQTPTATRKEEPAWENFSQAQPPKIKRNEMMLIPKWGNYPGDGGGGITLVIDTPFGLDAIGRVVDATGTGE